VYIPADVKAKIAWLCNKINKVEWSGILIYDIEGDITDAKKCSVHLKDIVPMDKGTSSYTTYKLDPKIIMDHYMKRPDHEDFLIGHIHSHHDMKTFFSGTDTDELHENAPNHNLYLSLIVNNNMDISQWACKLVFMGDVTPAHISFLDKEGDPVSIGCPNKERMLVEYNCVLHEQAVPVEDTHFLEGCERIMQVKAPAQVIRTNNWWTPSSSRKNPTSTQNARIKAKRDLADEELYGYPIDFYGNDISQAIFEEEQLELEVDVETYLLLLLQVSAGYDKYTDICELADALGKDFPNMKMDTVEENLLLKARTDYQIVFGDDPYLANFDEVKAVAMGMINDARLECQSEVGYDLLGAVKRVILETARSIKYD